MWLNYELNQEYITETYCINKDKPELGCNGKCHLAKQLTETNLQPNETEDVVYIPLIQLFFENPDALQIGVKSLKEVETRKPSTYLYEPVFKIEEPPKA